MRISDDMLCNSCESERSMYGKSVDLDNRAPVHADVLADVRNELLCYLQNKMDVMPQQVLIRMASSFYQTKEIEDAKKILYDCEMVVERNIKRQGPSKDTANVEDMLGVMHKTVNLPTFVAADLAKMPPPDINSMDFSLILAGFQEMRKEMLTMKEEFSLLKNNVSLMSHENSSPVPSELCKNVKSKPVKSSKGVNPPKSVNSNPVNSKPRTPAWNRELPTQPLIVNLPPVDPIRKPSQVDGDFTVVDRRKKKTSVVIGRGLPRDLKVVSNTKITSVFISRLDKDTAEDDLARFFDSNNVLSAVKCEKLKTKYDTYSSFKVDIRYSNIKDVYDGVNWPAGIFLRKYFNIKNG